MIHRRHAKILGNKNTNDDHNNEKQVNSFGDYMEMKRRKLFRQVHDNVVPKSNIFANISIYVNGYTNPPASRLRELVIENGGQYHHYFTRKNTTYMIASVLSKSKWKSFGKHTNMVIRPEWITESIRANKRLPTDEFMLSNPLVKSGYSQESAQNLWERQLTIHNFINARQKCEMLQVKINKNGCELVESEEQNRRIPGDNIRISCKSGAEVSNLDYGCETNNGIIHIGKIEIDLQKEVDRELVQRFVALYKTKLIAFDLQPLKFSVNFLERMLSSNELNVHPEWSVFTAQLKEWINAFCVKKIGAKLFP